MPSYLIHRGFLGSTGGRPCAVAMIVADCDSASTATESPPDVEAPPRPKQRRKKQTADAARPKQQPPYAVILFNDEEHTFQYVIETLMKVFGYPQEKSYSLTLQVHNDGKGIVWSGSREVAELKRDQIRAAGPDFYAAKKVDFPLGAVVEPLP